MPTELLNRSLPVLDSLYSQLKKNNISEVEYEYCHTGMAILYDNYKGR